MKCLGQGAHYIQAHMVYFRIWGYMVTCTQINHYKQSTVMPHSKKFCGVSWTPQHHRVNTD